MSADWSGYDTDGYGGDDELEDAEDEGFRRGWTARSTLERECDCVPTHEPGCVSQRRSWWQRVRRALS